MTIEEALREASDRLKSVATRPRLEAEILLSHYLKCERAYLHLKGSSELIGFKKYFKFIERRECCEPIEYITGRVSFYDFELEVGKGVLIPRPETEILVEIASRIIEEKGLCKVAEIGVGSGAVSIALARRFKHLKIVATDISKTALKFAKKNSITYRVEDRVELVESDLLEKVYEDFEMIVSNPPYISQNFELPKPVRFEPKEALFAGEEGDEVFRRILNLVKDRKIENLVCEMGYDQRNKIEKHANSISLGKPKFYKDLAGLDRVFCIESTYY